jgi:hypothetical protein
MALNRSLESHSHVVFKIKGGNLTKTQSNIIFPDWFHLVEQEDF